MFSAEKKSKTVRFQSGLQRQQVSDFSGRKPRLSKSEITELGLNVASQHKPYTFNLHREGQPPM